MTHIHDNEYLMRLAMLKRGVEELRSFLPRTEQHWTESLARRILLLNDDLAYLCDALTRAPQDNQAFVDIDYEEWSSSGALSVPDNYKALEPVAAALSSLKKTLGDMAKLKDRQYSPAALAHFGHELVEEETHPDLCTQARAEHARYIGGLNGQRLTDKAYHRRITELAAPLAESGFLDKSQYSDTDLWEKAMCNWTCIKNELPPTSNHYHNLQKLSIFLKQKEQLVDINALALGTYCTTHKASLLRKHKDAVRLFAISLQLLNTAYTAAHSPDTTHAHAIAAFIDCIAARLSPFFLPPLKEDSSLAATFFYELLLPRDSNVASLHFREKILHGDGSSHRFAVGETHTLSVTYKPFLVILGVMKQRSAPLMAEHTDGIIKAIFEDDDTKHLGVKRDTLVGYIKDGELGHIPAGIYNENDIDYLKRLCRKYLCRRAVARTGT